MGVKPTVEEEEGIEVDQVTASQGQTFRTFQTFASDWSSCSNVSFSKYVVMKSNSLYIFRGTAASNIHLAILFPDF